MGIRATTVFCDDIRTERSGKNILIGTYGSDLVLGSVPAAFTLALWIRIEGLPLGPSKFKIVVEMPGGEQNTTIEGEGELKDASRPTIMTFNGVLCEIDKAGEIICRFALDDGDLEEIGRLAVFLPPEQKAS